MSEDAQMEGRTSEVTAKDQISKLRITTTDGGWAELTFIAPGRTRISVELPSDDLFEIAEKTTRAGALPETLHLRGRPGRGGCVDIQSHADAKSVRIGLSRTEGRGDLELSSQEFWQATFLMKVGLPLNGVCTDDGSLS